jgi:hypothetical protein
MACDLLSSGRATPCKDVVGGIYAVSLSLTSVTWATVTLTKR